MFAACRSRALSALAALAVLGLGVSACAGAAESEEPAAPPDTTPRETATEEVEPTPPPPPPTKVRVVDGDTGKPVRGARVVARGETVAARGGLAEIGVPRHRVGLRVSAKGYSTRTARVDFRERLTHRLQLWRPALQWPIYGANPARTQVHPAIKIRPPFKVVWRQELHGLLEFPAVVWEGVAYVQNLQGKLRALSMEDGRVLWQQRVGTLMASSPAVDPERGVLVTTSMSPGYVSVVSMKTGRVRWRFYTGRAEPSPVIRAGIAYFGAANGNVYALDLDRRRARWTFRGGVKITSSPALVGNRLYFGDYAGRVFALNARTGRVVWRGSAGSRVYGTVAVAGGRVFAPSVFSGMSALSARTGRLLWRVPVGAYLYSSPAVYRGRVYFGTYSGRVYSVSASSGRVLWTRPSSGRVSGAVQIVGGVAYAASLEGRITAWHWRSGETLWSFPNGKYVPISGNGGRLLVHGGGQIWAVEEKKRRR